MKLKRPYTIFSGGVREQVDGKNHFDKGAESALQTYF